MKAIIFSVLLALTLAVTAEEETIEAKEKAAAAMKDILIKIEGKIRPVLQGLDPAPQFEYEGESLLKITYKTQIFKIHGQSMTGEIGEKTRDEVGPTYKGLKIFFQVQKSDNVNQAVTPQTIKEPYWTTFIDFIPSPNPEFKIYWGLSYGVRTDITVIKNLKQVMGISSK